MAGYGQYCPIAKAAEIVGDRWTMLIIRELLFGPIGFNDMARGLPGISRSILSQRLRHLERRGIIERAATSPAGPPTAYRFTRAGEQLGEAVKTLGHWAAQWVIEDPSQAELDPELLMLFISRHVELSALPTHRVVVEFDLQERPPRRYWLVLEAPAGVSVCLEDPQLDQRWYVHVHTSAKTLYRIYMGRVPLRDTLRDGTVRLFGQAGLVRGFASWFTWSSFAPTVRRSLAASRAVGQ